MQYKIAVIDRGFVSPYFDELFRIMNRSRDREYVVFYGDPPKGTGLEAAPEPYDFPNVRIENKHIPFLNTAVYQTLVRNVTSGEYDAVIIGHELKFLSNWVVAFLCRLKGIPIIFWGFGYHAPRGVGYRQRSSNLWNWTAQALKDRIARIGDSYLAYTQRGADRMRAQGLKCSIRIVRPSVNVEEQIRLHEKYLTANEAALRSELGCAPDSSVLLYIGRLVGAKGVDGLVEVVRRLNEEGKDRRKVEARIIGDGDTFDALKAQSADLPEVELLGGIYDQDVVAKYMRVAEAIVLPGAAGITVTHAFAHGKPVLTRENPLHSPEAEYVRDGENGRVVVGDFDAFVKAVAYFVDHPGERDRLSKGALSTRESFSMQRMADQFDEAVIEVLSRRREAR